MFSKKHLYISLLFLTTITFAQTTVQIGTSTIKDLYPIYTGENYSYIQQIYLANEINYVGIIQSIQFYFTGPYLPNNSNNIKVYIGHTSKNSFSSNDDFVDINDLTEVYNGSITYAIDS
ncbi:MAG: hypothetical protein K8H86_05165 [Ignavibacteriaceae bacterium]|nr:hypothetical protein [Ignavibacteriaceae bacterium]